MVHSVRDSLAEPRRSQVRTLLSGLSVSDHIIIALANTPLFGTCRFHCTQLSLALALTDSGYPIISAATASRVRITSIQRVFLAQNSSRISSRGAWRTKPQKPWMAEKWHPGTVTHDVSNVGDFTELPFQSTASRSNSASAPVQYTRDQRDQSQQRRLQGGIRRCEHPRTKNRPLSLQRPLARLIHTWASTRGDRRDFGVH